MQDLRTRLYKKFQISQRKTDLIIKKYRSIESLSKQKVKEPPTNFKRLRTNSMIKLPELQKMRLSIDITKNLITQRSILETNISQQLNLDSMRHSKNMPIMSLKYQHRKKIPNNETITNLLKCQNLTIPKIVQLLKKSQKEQYIYLKINGIYEFQAVQFQEKGTNYMTLSSYGILIDGELISVQRWTKQEKLYLNLRKIDFWKKYLILKIWIHWKKEMRKRFKKSISSKLIKSNLFTNEIIQKQIIQIRGVFQKMTQTFAIFDNNPPVNSQFQAFKQLQIKWMTEIKQKINKKQNYVESLLTLACQDIMKDHPDLFQQKVDINKILFSIDALNVRFDIKISLKKSLDKLFRLLKLIDLMFTQVLGQIIINNIQYCKELIESKSKIYEEKTNDLERLINSDVPKKQFISSRDEIISSSDYKTWIIFELTINNKRLTIRPSLKQVHEVFKNHIKYSIDMLNNVKTPYIQASSFQFIRRNIVTFIKNEQLTLHKYLDNIQYYQILINQFYEAMQNYQKIHANRLLLFQSFLKIYHKYDDNNTIPILKFQQILALFQDISKDIEYLDRLNDGEYITYGYINHIPFKELTLNKISQYKMFLSREIPLKFRKDTFSFKNQLENHIKNVDNVIDSAKTYITIVKQVNIIEEYFGSYWDQVNEYQKISRIYQHEFRLLLYGCSEIVSLLNSMKNKIEYFNQNKDSNSYIYKKQISTIYSRLISDTSNLQLKLESNQFYVMVENTEEVYNQLNWIMNKMISISRQLNELNDFEITLTMEVSKIKKLEYLMDEFESIKKVWQIINIWKKIKKQITNSQILEFELIKFEHQHSNFKDIINSVLKKKEKFQLAIEIKKQLEKFQFYIQILHYFQQKYLRHKDWQQIAKIAQQKLALKNNLFLNPTSKDLTIDYLLKNNIGTINSQILEIIVRSKKQIEIEEYIAKFELWWPKIRLQTQPYDNSNYLFVFTENQQLRRQIQQNMNILLSIMNNKYGTFMRSKCANFLRNLNNLIRLLEQILVYQHNFIDLYPILSSTFCEKQLPIEYKKYQNILNTTMRQMRILINPIKGLNQSTLTLFSSNNKQLQGIHKNLAVFLERKRVIFQRFYFVDDKELMELLAGVAKDSSIYRMFQGIKGWYYEDEVIVGVVGVGGQILKLKNWSFKNQQIQLIFKNLEQAIKYTLRATIRQTIYSFEVDFKNLRILQQNIPWMCTYAIQWILYCKQIQLNYLSNENDLSLQIQLLLENLNEIVRKPLQNSNLITLTLHMIHLTRQLKQNRVDNILDYNWQSILRFYFEDEVYIRSLGGVYQWGGEYQGFYKVMVNTKDIRRAYCCVLGGLNWGVGALMQGPSGTGKTETLKQLARSMAKFCLVFNCSSLISTKLLQRFLSGLCYTASWLCLDQINRLQLEVMSVIANQIILIKSAVILKKTKFNFFGKQILLKQGIGIFSTMNPNYKQDRVELTQNLKSYFRYVSLNIPDYEKIMEVMLFSKGFKDAENLAKKICKVYQILNMNFQQKHYDFGLRSMKSLIFKLQKYNIGKQSENFIIKSVIYQNIKPKLTENSISVFYKILQDTFPEIKLQPIKITQFEQKYQALKSMSQLATIVLGQSSCKSTLIKKYISQINPVYKQYNPISLQYIYFWGGKITSGWQTGIIQQIVKESLNNMNQKYLLYLDGKIKSQWIENLNTLLDDSKLLSLSNGARLKVHDNLRLMIETDDIEMASPATISRCGIIFVYSGLVNQIQYINKFFGQYYFPNQLKQIMKELLTKINRDQIKQIFNIFPCFLPNQLKIKSQGWTNSEIQGIIKIIVYLISLQGNYEKIKKYLSKEQIPPKSLASRCYLSFDRYREGEYIQFDLTQSIPKQINPLKIHIPTYQSELYKYIIHQTSQTGGNLLFKGNYGSGKTININSALSSIQQSITLIEVTLNKFTTSQYFIRLIQEKNQIVRINNKQVLEPLIGMKAFIFIQNIGLGEESPLQFLRTLVQTSQILELKTLVYRIIKNYTIIAETNKQRNSRLTNHFFNLSIQTNMEVKLDIFSKVFKINIDKLNLEVLIKDELYNLLLDKILRVILNYQEQMQNLTFSYKFSLKQLNKLAYSMLNITSQKIQYIEDIIIYFFNEINRIYHDRIVEKSIFSKAISTFKKSFTSSFGNKYKRELDQIIKINPTLKLYQTSQLYQKMKQTINQINKDLCISDFLMAHIIRIQRMIQLPYTNCLFIGQEGLGKRILLEIFAEMNQIKLQKFQLKSTDQQIRNNLFKYICYCIFHQKSLILIIKVQNGIQSLLNILQTIISGKSLYSIFSAEDYEYAYENISHAYTAYDKKNKQYENVVSDFIFSGLKWLKIIVMATNKNWKIIKDYPQLMQSCYINTINQWPEQSLFQITSKILSERNYQPIHDYRPKLNQIFLQIYKKIKQLSQETYRQTNLIIYQSPIQYIRFVKSYLDIVNSSQDALKNQHQKFSKAINRFNETQQNLQNMKNIIISMEPQLKIKKESLIQLLPGLQLKKKQIKQAKNIVQVDQQKVQIKKQQVIKLKNQAENSLNEAQPLLTEAANSVASIKRTYLSEIKSNNKPHHLVLFTLQNVNLILGQQDISWQSIKKTLSDTQLLTRLKGCLPKYDDYIKVKKRIEQKTQWTLTNIQIVSGACKYLAKWIINVIKFCEINNMVEYKKSALNSLKKQLIESEYQLKATQNKFSDINKKYIQLEMEFLTMNNSIKKLEDQIQINKLRLKRAQILQRDLKTSLTRWKQTLPKLSNQIQLKIGQSIFSAAILQLATSFPNQIRKKFLMFLKAKVSQQHLPFSQDYKILKLSNPIQRQKWQQSGLASDQASQQNAIFLTYHLKKFPIILDPDNQASNWLQKTYAQQFTYTKSTFFSSQKQIEKGLRLGHKILILIEDQLDDLVKNLIEAKIETKGNRKLILFMGNSLQINDQFRIILVNNIRNKQISRKLYISHPIINFEVTKFALQQQLVIQILKKQNQILYNEKNLMEITLAQNKNKLILLQTQIIESMINNKIGILDDENLIIILQNSINIVKSVNEQQNALSVKTRFIQNYLVNYKKLCQKAALIYITINYLSVINPILNFSYDAYMKLFLDTCQQTISEFKKIQEQPEEDIDLVYQNFTFGGHIRHFRPTSSYSRLSSRMSSRSSLQDQFQQKQSQNVIPNIISEQILRLYRKVTKKVDQSKKGVMSDYRLVQIITQVLNKLKMGLSQRERKILGFLIVTSNIDKNDLNYLLNTNTKRQSIRQYIHNGEVTKDIKIVDRDILSNQEVYKQFINSNNHFNFFPQLSRFSCVLLFKLLKPECFNTILEQYIQVEGYGQILSPPDIKMTYIFQQMDNIHPLLFIMGEDPIQKITQFLSRKKILKNTIIISMGQGQNLIVQRALERETKKQIVLILHNLHITPSVFPIITRALQQFEINPPNPKFRLILISKPSKQFPIPISSKSFKVMIQTPIGIQNKMVNLITNNFNMVSSESDDTKKIAYSIALFHSVINDRNKFESVGWNQNYQFSETEYKNSLRILKQIINANKNPNCTKTNIQETDYSDYIYDFSAIKYLIGQINYEGRITDQIDRLKLKALTNVFINPDIFKQNFKFLDCRTFVVPKILEMQDIMSNIEIMNEQPTIYGLHSESKSMMNYPHYILSKIEQIFHYKSKNQKNEINTIIADEKVIMELKIINHPLEFINEEIYKFNKYKKGNYALLKQISIQTKIFNLNAFSQPKKIFNAIKKQYSIRNQIEFDSVILNCSTTVKQEYYAISNVFVQGAKIIGPIIEDAHSSIVSILYIVPTVKRRQKAGSSELNKILIPLYKNRSRSGEVNTFGENKNLITTLELQSKRSQDFWLMRGTAFMISDSF